MVEYILGLRTGKVAPASIPLTGSYTPEVPADENGKGGYLLRAAYTDQSPEGLKAITSEKIIALRNPLIYPESADESRGFQFLSTPRREVNVIEDEAFLLYRGLDLTDIADIVVRAEASERNGAAGGSIEVRLDSPTGTQLGSAIQVDQLEIDFPAELAKLRRTWEEGGKKGPRPNRQTVRELFRPDVSFPVGGEGGHHDLYFIIRNSASKPGQILLEIDEIVFRQGGGDGFLPE